MEAPISPEQQKPNFFRRILGKITPQHKISTNPQSQQETVEVPLLVSQPEVKREPKKEVRQLDIGTQLIDLLEQNGAIITSKEFKSVGVAAILGDTNETVDTNLIEKVKFQEHAPDGYLIGIGAANVFRMLELYPEGQIPKAMILFDIDPEVVEQGQRFIEQLKRNQPEDDGDLKPLQGILWEVEKRRKLAPVLQQLAEEGNLVIAQADFTDERVTEALSNLPNLHDYNNVVYLSNISDHIKRRKHDYIPNFNFLESLTPKPPLKNYYVDTVQQSLNYRLRIGTSIPRFDEEDSKMRNPIMQTKPTDEIDGPQENSLYEDISTWNVQKLTDIYQRMESSPTNQERAKHIEARIKQDRDQTLKEYEEWKKKAQEPPEQEEVRESIYEYVYIVPTDPSEEEQVQKELAIHYNYEKDFIPFIADNIWIDKVTAREIYFTGQSRRDLAVRSIERTDTGNSKHPFKYKLIHTHDPRQQMKGKIENAYLEESTYEELAMAKLYREVEKRILADRPDADVVNKNFEELVEQISS